MHTDKTTSTIKAPKTSLHHLYDVFQSAKRSLDFYTEELQYLQKLLADIVSANTKVDVLSQAEHFQNQFIIVRDTLAELKSRINERLLDVEKQIRLTPTHTDEKSVSDLTQYSVELQRAESSFAAMKMEFHSFLAKYL